MSQAYRYGIEADALDDLDRLEYIAAFIADAICGITESLDHSGSVSKKCWQGLYYISQEIADRIAAINKSCGEITK